MARGGRPSKFKPEFVDQARKIAGAYGATDKELADIFAVSLSTLSLWKIEHPEFSDALKIGKDAADARVKSSLYQRATGYSYDAVKIFMPAGAKDPVYAPYTEHCPPDTTAGIFWLKNRDPENWRDRQQLEHTGAGGAPLTAVLNVTIGGARPEPSSETG